MNENPFSEWFKDGHLNLPSPPPWRMNSTDKDILLGQKNYLQRYTLRLLELVNRKQEYIARLAPISPAVTQAIKRSILLRRPIVVSESALEISHFIAHHLNLGPVLQWSIAPDSRLADALYQFDRESFSREQMRLVSTASQHEEDSIGSYIRLGPLGTALYSTRFPRVINISEINRANLSLIGDLLSIFDLQSFEIPDLARKRNQACEYQILTSDGLTVDILEGKITCADPPIVIISPELGESVPNEISNVSQTINLSLTKDILLKTIQSLFLQDDFEQLQEVPREIIDEEVNHFLISRRLNPSLPLSKLYDDLFLRMKLPVGEYAPKDRLAIEGSTAFLSYRRDDSSAKAVMSQIKEFCFEAGFKSVFLDVEAESIPFGQTYDSVIEQAIQQTNVFFAVIGDRWVELMDERGRRPNDPIVMEISIALEASKKTTTFIPRIVPILLESPMPSIEELPESIKEFHYMNGIRVGNFLRIKEELLPNLKILVDLVEREGTSRTYLLNSDNFKSFS